MVSKLFKWAAAITCSLPLAAMAVTPTVLWNGNLGDSVTVGTGDDAVIYSITDNGNTISNGKLTINNSANNYLGAKIDLPAGVTSVSVLIKYSNLNAYASANVALASCNVEKTSGGTINTGLRSESNGSLRLTGFYNGSQNVWNMSTTPTLSSSGYYLYSYSTSGGTRGYAGTVPVALEGGSNSSLVFDGTISAVSIGGALTTNKAYPWDGVVIEEVALFINEFLDSSYVFSDLTMTDLNAAIDAYGTYVSGADTVVLRDVAPSSATQTYLGGNDWNGTVLFDAETLENFNVTGYGKSIALKDCSGYLGKDYNSASTYVNLTVKGTFKQTNGWSYDSQRVLLAAIKGDGTLQEDYSGISSDPTQLFEVGTLADFKGTFNFLHCRVKSNNDAVLDKAQTIATLTVADTLTVTEDGSLTGNLAASNVVVTTTQTVGAGDVIVPVSGTVSVGGDVTLNGEPVAVECVAGEGVKFLAPIVTITVPKVANTTVEVSVGGNAVSPTTEGESSNTYSVAGGATVTVTYSSDDYEVTGGSFEFTASAGYTLDASGVSTAKYVASITIGESTVKYTALQAAIDAVAQNKDIVLLDNVVSGATVSREITFSVVPGGYTYGDIVAGGDYVLTTTALEGKTRYSFAPAVIAVTISDVRTLYPMITATTGIEEANAGPIGTTIEILSGDPSTYVEDLPMFDLNTDTGIFTKVANPVAAVYDGVLQVQVYRSLAEAVAAATAGQTVTLLADDHVSFSLDNLEIAISKALTIDGAGYTVYGVNDYAGGSGDHDIYISGSGDVTIKNITLANFAGGVSNNMRTYPIWTGSAYTGTLTLDNVTVQNFNRTAFNLNGGTVVVTNCTITGDTTKEAYFQEGIGVYNANVTIVDTAISNVGSNLEKEDSQIAACIQLGNPTGPAAGTGSITVVNGTYSGEYGIIVASNAQNTVSVQGGTFAGDLMVEEGEGGTIAVSGGKFVAEVPAEYCATGYEPKDNGDGTYGVREDKGWIFAEEGYWNYTGTWSGIASAGEKVTVETNATYMANRPSDGQLVTVAMTLSFDDANDEDEDVGDAKAAVRLASGETSGTYQFQLYTFDGANKVWTNATVAVAATNEVDYTFVFVLDLTNKTYTASIVYGATTNAMTVGGVTNILFANQGAVTPVQQIEFIGAGTVTSIEGSYEDAEAPVEEFNPNEEVTINGASVMLTSDQADWLNACSGSKAEKGAVLSGLGETAFNNAYLLNLNITDPAYDGTFTFEVSDFTVGDTTVSVKVTLTRSGEFDGPINGTLKLTGTDELGNAFEVKDSATITDEHFSAGDGEVTISFPKDEDTKFFMPVIE